MSSMERYSLKKRRLHSTASLCGLICFQTLVSMCHGFGSHRWSSRPNRRQFTSVPLSHRSWVHFPSVAFGRFPLQIQNQQHQSSSFNRRTECKSYPTQHAYNETSTVSTASTERMDHTHPNGSEETIDAITMIQVENTETDVDLLNNKAIDVVAMGSPMSASDENVKTTTMSDMTSSCSPSSIQSASSSGAIAIEGARSQPLDMPWSDVQASALHDKVSRFTVQVPKSSDNRSDNKDSAADTMRCVVLWRNLIYDTPALAGYPIETLIQQLRILSEKKEFPLHVNYEEVLPFLDAFEFEASGGMSANVYGVSGIADGTRIRTSPVNDVHVTLPFNFVCTADGSVLYELGRPLALESTQLQQEQQQKLQQQLGDYSLSGTTKSWQRNGKDVAAAMLATTVSDANRVLLERQQNLNRESIDPDLLQLGGLTALVIGGALAMESLSHHLTVNVFWV